LISRIEHAAKKIGATRIVLDSLNALFIQVPDKTLLRTELFRLIQTLKKLGATVVFTGERTQDYGEVTRHGIEEFVADNVIILLEERNRVSQGGIIIPDTVKETTLVGRVVRVGPGSAKWPVTVKPGDRVLLGEKGRPALEWGEIVVGGDDAQAVATGLRPGQEIRICRETELVAVFGEE
jgi:circadian clock protein KaiC